MIFHLWRFLRPTRLGLACMLAWLAAAPLPAAVTINVLGVPARVYSGTTLIFGTEIQGNDADAPVRWEILEQGHPLVGAGGPLVVEAGGRTARFLAPAVPADRTFTIIVRCGDAASAPRTFVVPGPRTPPAGPQAAGPAGAGAPPAEPPASGMARKRARTTAPTPAAAVPGPSARPASAASAPAAKPMDALPKDILDHVTVFSGPRAMAGLGRPYAASARRVRTRLSIHSSDLSDQQILALLQQTPNLLSLSLASLPKVTGAGLVRALAHAPKLRSLDVVGMTQLGPGDLTEIFNQNKSITELKATTMNLGPEVLQLLAPNLTRLTYRELLRPLASDLDLSTFHQLNFLNIVMSQFAGHRLPPSLRSLSVTLSNAFDGRGLPQDLQNLELHHCSRITAIDPLKALISVKIVRCPEVMPGSLALLGRNNPGLARLETDIPLDDPTLDALPLSLRELDLSQAQNLVRGDLARLTGLASLSLGHAGAFAGDLLPASLRSLTVMTCAAFAGPGPAAAGLTTLRVGNCQVFTCTQLPASLTDLWVENCPRATLTRMTGTLTALPGLRTLSFKGWGSGELDPGIFLRHPALERAEFRRLRTGPTATWVRPPAGGAGPAGRPPAR